MRIRNVFQGTKLFVVLVVICSIFSSIVFGTEGGKKYVGIVVEKVKVIAGGEKVSEKKNTIEKTSINPLKVAQNKEEKPASKEKIDEAIEKARSKDVKDRKDGLKRIRELAYKDKEGKEIKRAIPAVKEFVEEEFSKGGGYDTREAMELLVLISDDEAIVLLNKIARSGPQVKGRLEDIELTEAGSAVRCLMLLEAKKKFIEDTKDMSLEEKIKLLLNELKPVYSPPYDKYIKYGLGISTELFLTRIGKPAVPYLVEALEEVMEIYKKGRKGEGEPYNYALMRHVVLKVLGEIGDESVIPTLEKMAKLFDYGSLYKETNEVIRKIKENKN